MVWLRSRAFLRMLTVLATLTGYVALHGVLNVIDSGRPPGPVMMSFAAVAVATTAAAILLRRDRTRRARATEVVELARELTRRPPAWHRPVFLLLSLVGYLLLGIGFIAAVFVLHAGWTEVPFRYRLPVIPFAVVALVTGKFLLGRSRPRAVRGPERTLIHDARPPVLYLRGFDDDPHAAAVDPAGLAYTGLVDITSREQFLAWSLTSVGPVITCGHPGERLPLLGASRFYLPHDRWQPLIARLMSLSRLVVLRMGDTEGLRWELEHAVKHLPPDRLMIVLAQPPIPPGTADLLNSALPVAVTGLAVATAEVRNPWVSAIITFDNRWHPIVTPVRHPKRRTMPPSAELAHGLRAALATIGVQRRRLTWTSGVPQVAGLSVFVLAIPLLALLIRTWVILFR